MSPQAFIVYGASHITALVLIGISAFFFPLLARKLPRLKRRQIEVCAGAFALVFEGSWLIFSLINADPNLRKFLLPVHFCDFTFIAALIALFGTYRWAAEWTYYLGVGGSLQALLTPDLTADQWSWTCAHFMFMHGFTAVVGVYFLFCRRFPLSWLAPLRGFAAGYLYLCIAAVVNLQLGTNYGFLCAKPASASILDTLGGWPLYLVWMQIIALAVVLALHFAGMVARHGRRGLLVLFRCQKPDAI